MPSNGVVCLRLVVNVAVESLLAAMSYCHALLLEHSMLMGGFYGTRGWQHIYHKSVISKYCIYLLILIKILAPLIVNRNCLCEVVAHVSLV